MSIIQGNAHTSAGGGTPAGAVERSLRFNSADSAYLNRTPASAGNRKTWTWSCWYKATPAIYLTLFSGFNGSSAPNNGAAYSRFNNFGAGPGYDKLDFGQYNTGSDFEVYTVASFRDYSAWYHIVVVLDTTQATNTNRVKIYVNNTLQTLSGTYPTQNQDCWINAATAQAIGRFEAGIGQHLNGYLTEVNFIDGQALTPSSFGETDTNTGVWKPKAFSGTYGTNGFYLKFADNSGTTSTTLGKDSSGNGNNWTPNNFSVTAGVGNDSLVDSPTSYGTDTGVGGEVRGNYCTMNPLNAFGFASGAISNGNLDVGNGAGVVYAGITSTMRIPTTVPIYAEFTVTSLGLSPNGPRVGITSNNTVGNTASRSFGNSATEWVLITSTGDKRNSGSTTSYGTGFSINDVGMLAVDTANGKVWFGKNGTWFNSGAPASGTNAAYTNVSGEVYIGEENDSDDSVVWNFGQRAFAYTAPSGFKALCTQNLPTPTIGATSTTQANDYMNVVLYNGTNANGNSVTGVGFQPDFVWTKSRNAAYGHNLFDAVRGVYKNLGSNGTYAEETNTDKLVSFNSDGFTVNADQIGSGGCNYGTGTYVAWNWKANGAGSSNTAGTITSTVSANTTSGFSIVTYTGNGSANQTVGHGLGVAPAFGILKDRDPNSNNDQWQVFHTGAGDKYGYLSTNATFAGTAEFYPTSGSSTTVTIARGSPAATTNESGDRFVMYLFAPVAGYSAFGSYTGNGSADGPFVYLGFRPRFVMVKEATVSARDWIILDSARNTYNVADLQLMPNKSDAEATTVLSSTAYLDFLSNGFKVRNTSVRNNENTATYIYAAFAESPFKYSLAR